MQKYQNSATTLRGDAIKGAQITVTTLAGDLATLYSDNGVTPQANPIITGRDGEYAFYAADGRYNLTVAAPGYATDVVTDINLFDTEGLAEGVLVNVAEVLAAKVEVLANAAIASAAEDGAVLAVTQSLGHAAAAAASALEVLGAEVATAGSASAAADSAAAAAASKAASAHIYPGSYATDPTTRPDGTARQVGDTAFNSTAGLMKLWNGATWQASDINTANLAASGGDALLGHLQTGTGAVTTTVQDAVRRLESVHQNKKTRVIACVLRQNTAGSGWYLINDAGHNPLGIASVSVVAGQLTITYDFTASKVLSLIAVPDETFAAGGLTCGPSVGLTSAQIELFAPFEMRTQGTVCAWGNYLENGVDVTGTFDVAGGTLAVTHPNMVHVDAGGSPLMVSSLGAPDGNQAVRGTGPTKTGFVLNYMQPISGRLNGASVTSVNVGTSAVWDGTDTLTVTHPA
ncbi:MAG: hypothetical protein JWR74_2353, partial [Polaromonas sp.]|nr:hypothetical protein [Polaromonas sp.]